MKKSREKLIHSTSHGCPLGWLVDPAKKTIGVFRPGQAIVRPEPEASLEGEPVVLGFRVAVGEFFGPKARSLTDRVPATGERREARSWAGAK